MDSTIPEEWPTLTTRTFKLCTSKDAIAALRCNVIYAIDCTHYQTMFNGKTGSRLADRFVEHLRSVEGCHQLKRYQNGGFPVADNLNHVRVCGQASDGSKGDWSSVTRPWHLVELTLTLNSKVSKTIHEATFSFLSLLFDHTYARMNVSFYNFTSVKLPLQSYIFILWIG